MYAYGRVWAHTEWITKKSPSLNSRNDDDCKFCLSVNWAGNRFDAVMLLDKYFNVRYTFYSRSLSLFILHLFICDTNINSHKLIAFCSCYSNNLSLFVPLFLIFKSTHFLLYLPFNSCLFFRIELFSFTLSLSVSVGVFFLSLLFVSIIASQR